MLPFVTISFSRADRLLLAQVIGLRMLLLDASSLGELLPFLLCSRPAPSPTLNTSVCKCNGFVSS